MNRYEKTKQFIIDKLINELPETFYYHSLCHVLDVLAAAEMIGEQEKITDHQMELLRVAVLFHDSGFIVSSEGHEKIGCDMARETLPGFGYTDKEIDTICGMIMVTKYPHYPTNLLEEIICDADLDYLGREDFFAIGKLLYKELSRTKSISNEQEWNILQEKFLSSHKYFTQTSLQLRNARKAEHLNKIRQIVQTN